MNSARRAIVESYKAKGHSPKEAYELSKTHSKEELKGRRNPAKAKWIGAYKAAREEAKKQTEGAQ